MNKIYLLLFLPILVGCHRPDSTETEIESLLDEFEWQLQKDLRDDDLNGSFSMTIVKGNQIIRSKAFGFADLKELPADTSSIYRVGSISKSFTAFLMMIQVQKGVISLDEPIEKYLPEVREIEGYSDSTKFTFCQLASHMSGLARVPKGRYVHGTVEQWDSLLLNVIPAAYFVNDPGQKYLYSNIGFGILGLALSRAAGRPFTALMEAEVFEPLGMRNTFYKVPEVKMKYLAQGRSGGPLGGYDDARPKKEIVGRGWSIPNGGLWSTANDLAKFMFCQMSYIEILDSSNLAMMHTIQTPEVQGQDWYGLGFSIYQDSLIHTIGHQGGTPGYRADFLFERELGYGVILLRNYNWGITDLYLRSTLLLRRLKKLYNDEKV